MDGGYQSRCWYPRLYHATAAERKEFRLIGAGEGIHWETVDEDISAESIIAGRHSQESQTSLERWLKSRGRQARNAAGEPFPQYPSRGEQFADIYGAVLGRGEVASLQTKESQVQEEFVRSAECGLRYFDGAPRRAKPKTLLGEPYPMRQFKNHKDSRD